MLTDPAFRTDQAHALGDWVAGHGRNLTDIFITLVLDPGWLPVLGDMMCDGGVPAE